MKTKNILLLMLLISLMQNSYAQPKPLTITNGDSKQAKPKTIMGIKFDNCFLKDANGTYGMTGSLSYTKDETTKKTNGKLITLGNGDGKNGKENRYAFALNLPNLVQKVGVFKLAKEEDGEIVFNPKGTHLDLEYAVKSVTINIKTNDGKKISGEISGVFVLINKQNKTAPPQIIVTKLLFTNLEIIDSNN